MPFDLSKLSAPELDQLIAEAAQRRAKLQPEHPAEPPKDYEYLINPHWFVFSTPEGSMLQLRHAGLGWISLLIHHGDRDLLMSLLLRQALGVSRPPPNAVTASTSAPTAPPEAFGSGGKLH